MNLPVHLIYVVDRQPTWSASEITNEWEDILSAIKYWNKFDLPVKFELEHHSLWEVILAEGVESMDLIQLGDWLFRQNGEPIKKAFVYILRNASMIADGIAFPGESAIVVRGTSVGKKAHEFGHILGATDKRKFDGAWKSATEVVDVMSLAMLEPQLSWQTIHEICSLWIPSTGWQWL